MRAHSFGSDAAAAGLAARLSEFVVLATVPVQPVRNYSGYRIQLKTKRGRHRPLTLWVKLSQSAAAQPVGESGRFLGRLYNLCGGFFAQIGGLGGCFLD